MSLGTTIIVTGMLEDLYLKLGHAWITLSKEPTQTALCALNA